MRHLKQLRTDIQGWLMNPQSYPTHPMEIHTLARVLARIDEIEQEAMGE
jgi:hypothetical protein